MGRNPPNVRLRQNNSQISKKEARKEAKKSNTHTKYFKITFNIK